MAEIPDFPRRIMHWEVTVYEDDLPTISTLDELIAALTLLRDQEATKMAISTLNVYLTSDFTEFYASFMVEGPETDAEYSERFAEAQEILAEAGITDTFMQKALVKVNKALEKLGDH